MPQIPASINGVVIKFGPAVNRSVDQKIIDALRQTVKPGLAPGYTLSSIYISSANDQHSLPSRHVQGQGKAIDISRINGKRMGVHYGSDKSTTAIVEALQKALDKVPYRRENFGPFFKRKLGAPFSVPGHRDHIHFSVN